MKLPMHIRAPAPNGKYAIRGRSLTRSGSKRCGSKASGLSQKRGLRWETSGDSSTEDPPGMWKPASSSSATASRG